MGLINHSFDCIVLSSYTTDGTHSYNTFKVLQHYIDENNVFYIRYHLSIVFNGNSSTFIYQIKEGILESLGVNFNSTTLLDTDIMVIISFSISSILHVFCDFILTLCRCILLPFHSHSKTVPPQHVTNFFNWFVMRP